MRQLRTSGSVRGAPVCLGWRPYRDVRQAKLAHYRRKLSEDTQPKLTRQAVSKFELVPVKSSDFCWS